MKMEFIDFTEISSGYRERMRRLALLEPLIELERRQVKDELNQAVDMRGLGLLTLLFFFERRLTREYKTGKIELAQFLQEMTRTIYTLSDEQMEKIASDLITTFRPSTGFKRSFEFFNWETKTVDQLEYSIIKDNDFDTRTQRQYYTLDEDGLELIFATKEFYAEFQISINQLLLKQQIKKGQFHDALRQVREMEIDVSTLKDRMENMHAEILRTIISEETYERYEQLLNDVYERLEREDEEFKELHQFIIETKDTIFKENMRQEEAKSYALITQILAELEAVHYEHSRLLDKTQQLRTTALITAKESLYYTGIKTFNFDQDIVANILLKPLSPDKMKGVLHPFLRVEQNSLWSPLTIFAEQTIIEEREESKRSYLVEADSEDEAEMYRQLLAEKYAEMMRQFIIDYEAGNAATLKEWLEHLKHTHENWLAARYFYSFWMMLHQYSPLTGADALVEEGKVVLQDALKEIGSATLIVEELPDIIHVHPQYSIQNMHIKVEEVADELS